ncbi:cyclic nucleotide-binding domain-containing protein [Butyricicoccus sp.]|uniref:cyclic nucleotide-binding domain-containing protein n=1 Tax=Butyricicoccus sp. TaxID=2049021 RepID=UPI003734F3A0
MEKDHMLSSQGRLSQLIKELPDERADYLFRLLHNAPIWLFEDIHILTVDANQAFIHEGDPVDRVYLLLDGKVRAVDYRIMNIECHYTHFTPVRMFGTMEALNSIEEFKTTLIAETTCTMLYLPVHSLLKWMKQDCNALHMERRLNCCVITTKQLCIKR